jgi:hypothetical protein
MNIVTRQKHYPVKIPIEGFWDRRTHAMSIFDISHGAMVAVTENDVAPPPPVEQLIRLKLPGVGGSPPMQLHARVAKVARAGRCVWAIIFHLYGLGQAERARWAQLVDEAAACAAAGSMKTAA